MKREFALSSMPKNDGQDEGKESKINEAKEAKVGSFISALEFMGGKSEGIVVNINDLPRDMDREVKMDIWSKRPVHVLVFPSGLRMYVGHTDTQDKIVPAAIFKDKKDLKTGKILTEYIGYDGDWKISLLLQKIVNLVDFVKLDLDKKEK